MAKKPQRPLSMAKRSSPCTHKINYRVALTESRPFSRQLSDGFFIGFQPSAENQPPWKKFKYGINYMNWWWNFSISLKNFEIFFAWNVLKHKVKPKNSRNSTFFKKLKFPPYFWKNTCKIFKSKMFTLVCCNFSKSQGKTTWFDDKFFYQSEKFWKKFFCLKCPET